MDWVIIFPQLVLTAGGFIAFCVGAFLRQRPAGLLLGIALCAAILSGLGASFLRSGAADFHGLVDGSDYARFFTILFSLITVITLLFADRYARIRDFSGDEFYGVILFAALGMVLVGSAIHWLTFFLGLEMLSISLYILIAAPRGEPAANEAALKYFIMSSVASGFLTFGIAVIYAVTGKMQIAQSLAVAEGGTTGVILGLALVLTGIGFKVSLVPFHLWTPDVYQGAPAPVTAFLSTGSKVALFSALLRFSLNASGDLWAHLLPALWVLAALTMVVGNVSALTQTHLKRLLAYSSVAQMGYVLMALLAVKQNGASAVMFYLAIYALMDLGAFGTVAALSSDVADRDAIEDYQGLGYARPWQSALLTVCLLSLAGLPPTAGFIGKFAAFQAVLQGGFVAIAVIGISASIISIYFYLKVIVSLYMNAERLGAVVPSPGAAAYVASGVVFVLVFWLGIIPSSLFAVISRIVATFAV